LLGERWVYTIPLRWRSLFRRQHADQELEDELSFHVERRAEEYVANGVPPGEARRRALLDIGGIEQCKEECREMRKVSWLHDLADDLRYGARVLRKNVGFTTTAGLTLAIGIGATSAVFSVVNGVVLRPFPFVEPDRLVVVWEYMPAHPLKYMFASPPDFADWRTQSDVLESLGAFRPVDLNRTDAAEPERIQGAMVTGSLFPTLGVAAIAGRTVQPDDDRPSAPAVAVLSFGYWHTRFGGRSDVLGRSLTLNGEPHTVVGVMPREFRFPVPFGLARAVPAPPADVWVPFRLNYATGQRGAHFLYTIGRLRKGVSLRQAEAAMAALATRIGEREPTHRENSIRLFGLREQVVSVVSRAIYILFGAVGAVLLIACANVANMQLARATARVREISLRAALGARRTRIVRMLLVESTLLSLVGGAAGLLLAWALVRIVVTLGPQSIPRLGEVALDWHAAAFAAAISLSTGVLFGLAPAAQASRVSVVDALKDAGRTGAAVGMRLRRVLVVTQVALSLVLLVAAGLLMRAFVGLHHQNFGFSTSQVLVASLSLPQMSYGMPDRRAHFFEQLLGDLTAQPEVEAAGAVMALPLLTNPQGTPLVVEGRPTAEQSVSVGFALATPGYLVAMRIPLVRGRDFTSGDHAGRPPVVLVNEALANLFFRGEDPVGQRIRLGNAGDTVLEIVGVSADVHHTLSEFDGIRPMVWRPYAQAPWAQPMSIVVRSRLDDPAALIPLVRSRVAQIDPALAIYNTRTMDDVFRSALAQPRFSTTVLGLFAAVALVLAALGVYGLFAYMVSRRRQEMAVRVAVGAEPRDLLRLMLSDGMKMTFVGAVIGLGGAFAATRFLQTQLYGISAVDVLPFAGATAVLTVSAFIAYYIPARRAARVHPMEALRHE